MFTRGYSWAYKIYPTLSYAHITLSHDIPNHFPPKNPYSLVKSLLLVGQIAAMFWCYPTSLYQTHIKSLLDAYICICICICICIYHYICIIDRSLSRISPYYHPIQPIPIWNNRVSVFVRECQLEAMHHHPGTFMDTGHSQSLVEFFGVGDFTNTLEIWIHMGLETFAGDFCWWFLGWKLGIPWGFCFGIQATTGGFNPSKNIALGHFLIGIHPMVGLRGLSPIFRHAQIWNHQAVLSVVLISCQEKISSKKAHTYRERQCWLKFSV